MGAPLGPIEDILDLLLGHLGVSFQLAIKVKIIRLRAMAGVNPIKKGAILGDQLRNGLRFGTVGTFVGSPGGPLDLATAIGGLVLDLAVGRY